MTELEPGQIELSHPSVGTLLIGEGTPYTISEWEPGGPAELDTHDGNPSSGDGRTFNRDTRGGSTVDLTFYVDTDNIVDASRAYSDATRVWNAAAVRAVEDEVVMLRSRMFVLPTRVAYGRPRKISPAREKFLDRGVMDLVTSFDTRDGLWYSDPADIVPVTIPLIAPQAGGWVAPFTAPITVATTTEGFGDIVVDGDEATPLVARLHGPWSTPSLELLGQWRFTLNTSIRRGEWVDLDARPNRREVYSSTGANLSGRFSPESPPLSELVLPPGRGRMVARGIDETGTAYASVSWQGIGSHPYWVSF